MAIVPTTFLERVRLALHWAALDEPRLLKRCRCFPDEARLLLVGEITTEVAIGAAAAEELADVLDVGRSWLLDGTPSVAARRLVRELELATLGMRVGETGDISVPASDYSRIIAQAASVPGDFAFDDTLERHPCGPTGSSGG